MIGSEEFDKVEMRAGTVLEVKDNKKSRKRSQGCATFVFLSMPSLSESRTVSSHNVLERYD